MTLGPPLASDARVLVRLPSWLGDFVMAEPALRALAAHVPRGELTLVARAAHLELLDGRFPDARRLALEDPLARGARAWRGHDVAFLCTGSFRSAWLAFRAGIPRRVGFARGGRGWLLSDSLAPARERGAVPLGLGRSGRGRRYLPRPLERSLAELLGLLGVAARGLRPRLELRPAWLADARARRAALGLAAEEPFLLANVGARADSAKGFPPERWVAVLAELARTTSLPLLLACGPGEEPALAAVQAGLPGARALRAPPAALPELAAHCAEARLVLTADSGPRHVARALGSALVCVAGPSDPRHTAGERGAEVLVRTVVPCGPCHRERCPLTGAGWQRCMREIAPERVVAAALALLARGPSGTIPACVEA